MPRLTQLNDVLFPVEEHPVFVSVKVGSGERRVPVPEKKAIVNGNSGRVLSIVSRGYRLVTNREALDMASKCCRTVFPETQPNEWEVRTTDAPATGGHCFIDLVHNSTALDFTLVSAKERPDAFGPFIRVANSYTGARALAFDIGVYRKVCENGMIVPQSVIRFTFTHQHRDIGETIEFKIAHEKLAKFRASIGEYLEALRKLSVARGQFEPLAMAVLKISKPKKAEPESPEAVEWDILLEHLREMSDRYAKDLGENAYAVFNIITDFASHPPSNDYVRRERHSFQRLAGAWLNDFSRLCREPGFDLAQYIKKLGQDNGERTEPTAAGRTRGRGASW